MEIIVIAIFVGILIFDLWFIPWALMNIIGWFGVTLSFWQCLLIVLFFNLVTYGFRKK